MKKCCIIDDIEIELNRAEIFKMIDCYENSPVFEEVAELYEEQKPWVMAHGKARAVLALDHADDAAERDGLLYLLTTIGPEIESESSRAFTQGDYLKGMLLDAIADDFLFQIENAVNDRIRQFCGEIGRGIERRMEAPADVPMEYQKTVLDVCGVADAWGMRVTSGFMYFPIKSQCVIFALTKDPDVFRAQHDCSRCPALHCRLRR